MLRFIQIANLANRHDISNRNHQIDDLRVLLLAEQLDDPEDLVARPEQWRTAVLQRLVLRAAVVASNLQPMNPSQFSR